MAPTKTAQITCINKIPRNDFHNRIQNVGGIGGDGKAWKITQPACIALLKGGDWQFTVYAGGKVVRVIVAQHNGHDYIKTEADGLEPNNLLSLPECP
jgi:hypothetical protein